MDYDIRKHAENKDINGAFAELIIVSLSIFIGFYWKDLLTETIHLYLPYSQGIITKVIIGIIMTIAIIYFSHFIIKYTAKRSDKK